MVVSFGVGMGRFPRSGIRQPSRRAAHHISVIRLVRQLRGPRRYRLRATGTPEVRTRLPKGANMGGKTDEAKGRIKEATGSLTDNKRLEAEGSADRAKGSIKDVKGDAEDKAGDARDKVKDAVGRD